MCAPTSTTSSYDYQSKGDLVNILILFVSLLYAVCVVYFTQPGREGLLFDKDWHEDGFCISNRHVPYWSSFDTCLYVDVLLSMGLGALYMAWKNIPGMENASQYVPMTILGTLGHGLAHGVGAAQFRDELTLIHGNATTLSGEGEKVQAERPLWQWVAFFALFWFPLLKTCLISVPNTYVAVLAMIVVYAGSFLKEQYGFTYVQTILAVAFHSNQLFILPASEKQKREYFTFSLYVTVLPLFVAWNEALFCNAYFRSLGGHVLYDASIIIAFTMFYADTYWHLVTSKKGYHEKTA